MAYNQYVFEQVGVKLRITAYQILVLAPSLEEKTKGGLYRLDSYKEDIEKRSNIGKVIGFGKDAFTEAHEDRRCNEGDWILFSNMEKVPFFPCGHRVLVITDAQILVVFDSEDEAKSCLENAKVNSYG